MTNTLRMELSGFGVDFEVEVKDEAELKLDAQLGGSDGRTYKDTLKGKLGGFAWSTRPKPKPPLLSRILWLCANSRRPQRQQSDGATKRIDADDAANAEDADAAEFSVCLCL